MIKHEGFDEKKMDDEVRHPIILESILAGKLLSEDSITLKDTPTITLSIFLLITENHDFTNAQIKKSLDYYTRYYDGQQLRQRLIKNIKEELNPWKFLYLLVDRYAQDSYPNQILNQHMLALGDEALPQVRLLIEKGLELLNFHTQAIERFSHLQYAEYAIHIFLPTKYLIETYFNQHGTVAALDEKGKAKGIEYLNQYYAALETILKNYCFKQSPPDRYVAIQRVVLLLEPRDNSCDENKAAFARIIKLVESYDPRAKLSDQQSKPEEKAVHKPPTDQSAPHQEEVKIQQLPDSKLEKYIEQIKVYIGSLEKEIKELEKPQRGKEYQFFSGDDSRLAVKREKLSTMKELQNKLFKSKDAEIVNIINETIKAKPNLVQGFWSNRAKIILTDIVKAYTPSR